MADSSLLAQLISGTNPNAPLMLGGYQGSQLSNAALNPEFAKNEGPFGALAKTLAGFAGPGMLQRGVEATTAANNAARPDLAKLLASQDPYADLAKPGAAFNPLAAAQILQGTTPEQVAQTRLHNAQAGLAGARVAATQDTPQRRPLFGGGGGGAPAAGGAAAPATSGATTLRPSAAAGDLDPMVIGAMPPAQAAETLSKATPAQIAAYRAKLNAMKARGGSAPARPPT